MELNEIEKRLLVQVESEYQSKVLNETRELFCHNTRILLRS